jgi:hypothetical protein
MPRTWFTPESTTIGNLTAADLGVLNLAARRLFSAAGPQPSTLDLMTIRQLYKPGMSGLELIEVVENHTEKAHSV